MLTYGSPPVGRWHLCGRLRSELRRPPFYWRARLGRRRPCRHSRPNGIFFPDHHDREWTQSVLPSVAPLLLLGSGLHGHLGVLPCLECLWPFSAVPAALHWRSCFYLIKKTAMSVITWRLFGRSIMQNVCTCPPRPWDERPYRPSRALRICRCNRWNL